MDIHYNSIGVIHSPFQDILGMPIQPSGATGIQGSIEIFPEFQEGLKDLDGFSHIILLYHFHQCSKNNLIVTPFLDSQPHGIFATRSPSRPNKIGLSVVKLLKIQQNIIHIENVDILNKTPLLDIKPYVPKFDNPQVERIGWLEHNQGQVIDKKADARFA